MTIFSFYIFDRHCNCIYHREYVHERKGDGKINQDNDSDSSKLLFGIIFSLKNVSSRLGDTPEKMNLLKSFSTLKYRVHVRESASGLKFVVVTDTPVDNLQSVLQELYGNFYVRNVAFNALSPVDFGVEQKINNSRFIAETDNFLMTLPIFD